MNNVIFALTLTIIAGLATSLGGALILFSKIRDKKFLSICLSFSAGAMLYIAFAEILLEAFESMKHQFGGQSGYLIATLAFFAGVIIMAIIDKFIPHDDHDENSLKLLSSKQKKRLEYLSKDDKELKRTGVLSAIAVAMHNLPEGIITFMAVMHDPALGIAIAIAIIIHNIPEGISIAAPIYYSTGSKMKGFFMCAGAGIAEFVGSLIAWLFIYNIFGNIEGVFGIPFAFVAGVMVFVAIHKLLPAAQRYGEHHAVMRWLFYGMAVMAISLVLLEYVV
jgi:ZIP family zinc transporter